MTSQNLVTQEQLAWNLFSKHKEAHLSWVTHGGVIYYSAILSNPDFPGNSVTQLIQYLFDNFVDQSFFILRNRIYTTEPESRYAENMVRLAAKRITFGIKPMDHGIAVEEEFIEICGIQTNLINSIHVGPASSLLSAEICNVETAAGILRKLIEQIPRGSVLHQHNRTIAAVLCDKNGTVLEVSTNQNFKNKTLHAELLLVQNFFKRTGKKIPEGSQIFVSLKPCIMCASCICAFAENPETLRIYFIEDDPGLKAKNSELEKLGVLHRLEHVSGGVI